MQRPRQHRTEFERLTDDVTTGFEQRLADIQLIKLRTSIDEIVDSGCRTA